MGFIICLFCKGGKRQDVEVILLCSRASLLLRSPAAWSCPCRVDRPVPPECADQVARVVCVKTDQIKEARPAQQHIRADAAGSIQRVDRGTGNLPLKYR